MHAVVLWAVVISSVGVDVGWQPADDGGLEYIIQIEPQVAARLKAGDVIEVGVRPELRDVRRYRIVVGSGPLPRDDGSGNNGSGSAARVEPDRHADQGAPARSALSTAEHAVAPDETTRPTLTAVAPESVADWSASDPLDAHRVEDSQTPTLVPERFPLPETPVADTFVPTQPDSEAPLAAPPLSPPASDLSLERPHSASETLTETEDPYVGFAPIPPSRSEDDHAPTDVEDAGPRYGRVRQNESSTHVHTTERYPSEQTHPEKPLDSMTRFKPDPEIKLLTAVHVESNVDEPSAPEPEAVTSPAPPANPSPPATLADEPRPWFPLTAALFFLFASIGGNVYLGWITWDLRRRFRKRSDPTRLSTTDE